MKFLNLLLGVFLLPMMLQAQTQHEKVTRAGLDYIEGFYEGDTTKLIRSLKPTLYKIGFYKETGNSDYTPRGIMTYRRALDYATGVLVNKRFPKADVPKKVEVLDILHATAVVKITAWWGYDYLLLSKQQDQWMIESIIWEGPVNNAK